MTHKAPIRSARSRDTAPAKRGVRVSQDRPAGSSRSSPTKTRLLDAAERLMLAKGYAATTVEEICDAAKLTKGSFFHYFESKEALGKELLERFCRAAFERMRQAVAGQTADPLKRVYVYVDFMITMSNACDNERGCLLGTFAQELSDTYPVMRSLCAKAFEQWADLLKHDLDEARAMHLSRRALDTRGLANHFIAVVEGSKILAKTRRDASIEANSLQHFKRYLDSVFQV